MWLLAPGLAALAGACCCVLAAWWLLGRPVARRDAQGNVLDPVGSSRLKNTLGQGMALVAKARERASFAGALGPLEIERFHRPEPHPFFNESYYYNGCDERTRDRIITRISRRGAGGGKSYVFLLIDSARHGPLSLEQDDVPASVSEADPCALGLRFELLEPMRRWRLTFKGRMSKGCPSPAERAALRAAGREPASVEVELDLVYERDSPVFWYMRDDCAECLGRNLSQEPWGLDFVKVCLKRSKNHGHYEDYGPLRGSVRIGADAPARYDFATFRDHSWDIRRWQTMDHLFIVLVALETPLRLFGFEYKWLDLTLVSMPGNSSGVARYSTGYVLPDLAEAGKGAPVLALTCGTSIDAIPWRVAADGATRLPMARHDVVLFLRPEPAHALAGACSREIPVRVVMSGEPRRLIYYPDKGAFMVYEDMVDFAVSNDVSGQTVKGYGTRQSGFRCGAYDPSLGGCG
jgi:hypothetical protein